DVAAGALRVEVVAREGGQVDERRGPRPLEAEAVEQRRAEAERDRQARRRQPLDADAPERDAGADRSGRQQPPSCELPAHCPATVAPTWESGSASASIDRLRARVSAFDRAV